MKFWIRIAGVLGIVGALIFLGSRNTGSVGAIDLGIASFAEVPLWQALLGSALSGAALAALVFSWPVVRLKLAARRRQKRIAELEQELHGLRTLPLGDEAEAAPLDAES
ncbi:MAG: DUF1049 domain-containing protein [Proteobacteria bacterium]|nr:DUF1049 domain-containing protein [Pseudomonadota bacterium]